MNFRKITNELSLYSLALFLAVFLRLLNLGAFPLSDQEANWALQAQQISQLSANKDVVIGSQPAYIFTTGLTFILLNTSNFLARFWPAVIGAMLVITPYLFRNKLGKKAALLLAWGLALDPGLVAVSRQAGGPMMALTFAVLSLGFWVNRRSIAAGILAALALLSGAAIMHGISIGLLGWLVFRRSSRSRTDDEILTRPPGEWKIGLFALLATFLTIGTLFFRYPQGISGWTSAITEFLAGISQPSGTPAWRILVTSWVYQPLPWIFALAAVFRTLYQWLILKIKPAFENFVLMGCAGFALGVVLIYPRHTTSDLVWFTFLLWSIAAQELSQWLEIGEKPVISWIQAGLIFIFSGMLWNTLISVSQVTPQAGVSWALLQALVLTGILGLAGLSAILVSYTWSWPVSRFGLAIGSILTGMVYSLAVLWSATQIRPNSPVEFWNTGATTAQSNLLLNSIQDLSNWATGMPDEIEMVVTVDSPAMRWILRDFKKVQYMSQIPSANLPALVITPSGQETLALSAAYRGQDFPWQIYPGWTGALPNDFVPWLTFRKAAEQKTWVILWARVDLFPGEQLSIPSSETE